MIIKEHNLVARQSRVKNHLNSLRVVHLIDKKTNAAAALSKVFKRILSISHRVPQTHTGDGRMIEFFRRAVIRFNCAKESLSLTATGNLLFQQLYSEAEISVQLKCKSNIAAASAQASEMISSTNQTSNKIFFNGKGRFV